VDGRVKILKDIK